MKNLGLRIQTTMPRILWGSVLKFNTDV